MRPYGNSEDARTHTSMCAWNAHAENPPAWAAPLHGGPPASSLSAAARGLPSLTAALLAEGANVTIKVSTPPATTTPAEQSTLFGFAPPK